MSFLRIRFTETTQPLRDMLIALLSELQYEGFEEDQQDLDAYIKASAYNKEQLDGIADRFRLVYTVFTLPDTNWNQVWESNFQPVTVDDFCALRADFHEPVPGVRHEIIITPKMSFGTGHHATTFMMIQQMEQISFTGKTVLDFGTGTGVLSILASKLGAGRVVAVDNDDWSITNAAENIERNHAGRIKIVKADSADLNEQFDVVLANITRNVILDNFLFFMSSLSITGILLVSGLISEDEEYISSKAKAHLLILEKRLERNGWICLRYRCP